MLTPYFTKTQLRQLPMLHETEDIALEDKKVIVKLFYPASNWTWYVIEYDGEDTCWGLVEGHETEYGYFSLSELAQVKGPFNLGVERDKWFTPMKVRDIKSNARRRL